MNIALQYVIYCSIVPSCSYCGYNANKDHAIILEMAI